MITLHGIIKKITFQNEDTGFTVLQMKDSNSCQEFSCVGIMPSVSIGERLLLQGVWDSHKRFGKQFSVQSYETIPPDTLEGITNLLSSGLITNIGPVRGRAIVDTFGMSTLEILDSSPDRLVEVPGIGKKTQEKISLEWKKQRHLKNLSLFLQQFEISVNLTYKIFKLYGANAQKKICENPYTLIDDLRGIGFVKADRIAQKMGYLHNSFKRIRAGIIFTLQEALIEGHSCLPKDIVTQKASEILAVDKEKVFFSLDHILETRSLIIDSEHVYLPVYYRAERFVEKNIGERIHFFKSYVTNNYIAKNISEWLENYQTEQKWYGDPLQIKAITTALENPLFLLTGGPGTGKTTILKVITTYFIKKNFTVTLVAPTGRAAERMSSVTGLPAKTIHRLLEYKPGTHDLTFQKNENNPLVTDVIIIDEVSMVDLLLMHSLLVAIPITSFIILIGDNNQLPSVGAGNILSDFILGKIIPHVHLSTVFRQAAYSRIVTAAHEIINGEIPDFKNLQKDNCFFISKPDPQECADCIVDLVYRRLPDKYGFNPIKDIQVITPMHKGILGTQYLNSSLQNVLNKNSKTMAKGIFDFYVGDKVMQIKNNYDTGIFNGDIGFVTEIINDTSLIVDYNNTIVEYSSITIEEIQPAYCITIHKSQGCEFKAVIIPVSTQHYIMLQRNLLYTALTRAKILCVLVGTKKALSMAINNSNALHRYSRLADLLRSI